MRRAGGYSQNGYQMLEDENEKMVSTLSNKVQELKSLSIDIGNEVKYQNKMLNEMDDEFGGVGSLLQGTMNRLTALAKKGHHNLLCYVMLFFVFVMFVAWLVVRFM